jgi:hypothetical protein
MQWSGVYPNNELTLSPFFNVTGRQRTQATLALFDFALQRGTKLLGFRSGCFLGVLGRRFGRIIWQILSFSDRVLLHRLLLLQHEGQTFNL